jgi:RiboL-PSP-HEPN
VERSRAYVRLTERFGEVRLLLGLCSSPETEPQAHRSAANTDAALLRGALVLLCSHLEGFFEDLIEEALHAFDLHAPKVSAIPLVIRQRQVTHALRLAERSDAERHWRGLLDCVAHPLLRDDDPCSPGARKIDPDLHIRGFANPGTSEIDHLMASIGLSDSWTFVAAELGNKRGANTVNAVVNRRNQIAHGNLESSVSRPDVEDYVNVLEQVCGQFDIVVGRHLCSHMGGPDPWTSG